MEIRKFNIEFDEESIFFNYLCDYKSGIIKYLNNFRIFTVASNSIGIDTGMIVVYGIKIVNKSIYNINFNNLPKTNEDLKLILELRYENNDFNYSIKTIPLSQELIKEEIYIYGQGIYQKELATFSLTNNGIENLKQTIDFLKKESS